MRTSGHVNPESKMHGIPNSGMNHAGSLPNHKSDSHRNATHVAKLYGFGINSGTTRIVGLLEVVHRDIRYLSGPPVNLKHVLPVA